MIFLVVIMKLAELISILSLGNAILLADGYCRLSVASKAIVNILEDQFSGSWQSKVDLIYFEDAIELADEILHHLPANISVKVINGSAGVAKALTKLPEADFAYSRDSEDVMFLPWNNILLKSSVLLFDSPERYKEGTANIKWLGNRWFRYNHIVYALNLTKADVIEVTKDGFEIDAVAFLMNETAESIELVSSFMFTAEKCRHNQLKTINRYNARASAWEKRDFYPPKYRNFFNCTLTFLYKSGDFESQVPICIIANIPTPNCKASGRQLRYEKHNASTIDLINDYTFIGIIDDTSPKMIYPFITVFVNLICILPDGEPFTLLEKMFMMFDIHTWIAIGCTLLFWFCSAQVISLMPHKLRDQVYGKNVKTPAVNLLNIFLSGGQHKVPSNKLAKYLLMLFVVWSLIIRTCYQSKLFEHLQSDLRRPYDYNLIAILHNETPFSTIPGLRDDKIIEKLDIVAEYANLKYAKVIDAFISLVNRRFRSGKGSRR